MKRPLIKDYEPEMYDIALVKYCTDLESQNKELIDMLDKIQSDINSHFQKIIEK